MSSRSFSGLVFLIVCLLSIGLQLPQRVDGSSAFGIFGSEALVGLEPDCNAIAPKNRNCKDFASFCLEAKYIAGPQSAESGGVNTLRYDKTGTLQKCTTVEADDNIKVKCPSQEVFKETGKCKETMVLLEDEI